MDNVRRKIRNATSTVSSLILGPPEAESLISTLEDVNVPVTSDPCRECPNPCDDSQYAHEEWPSKMFLDTSTDMLGRVKPYFRQVLVSTGKSDWEKEVTDAKGSLAHELAAFHSKQKSGAPNPNAWKPPVDGIIAPEAEDYLMVLNGSHRTTSEDASKQTVLVFPDFKMVTQVASAEELWKSALDPTLGKAGAGTASANQTKSWVLPYTAVMLLCSHKRRDNRCAIAAPVLKRSITQSLEALGWEVHDQLDDPDLFDEPALEDIPGTPEEREADVVERLKAQCSDSPHHTKRALILYCSHIGGHKYAGNVIIYTPQGAGVWYGRVSSHEVGAVVKTVTEGKVFPTLLRGGVNLTRPKGKTLIDW